jgi:riboflavin synthase
MFTGIVEALGTVLSVEVKGTNKTFHLSSPFISELKIDQSLAHNGVCLTVDGLFEESYSVTAIQETLLKTALNDLKTGDNVNLERCMMMNGRLDGHIVQGHVDTTAVCTHIQNFSGSWSFRFTYEQNQSSFITVPKGSICINGVSLTVVDSLPGEFSVAIIPYTYENTTFRSLSLNDKVNLEFDILGKYIARFMENRTA